MIYHVQFHVPVAVTLVSSVSVSDKEPTVKVCMYQFIYDINSDNKCITYNDCYIQLCSFV